MYKIPITLLMQFSFLKPYIVLICYRLMVYLINRTLSYKFMYYIRPNKGFSKKISPRFIPPPSFHMSEPKFRHTKQKLTLCQSPEFRKLNGLG